MTNLFDQDATERDVFKGPEANQGFTNIEGALYPFLYSNLTDTQLQTEEEPLVADARQRPVHTNLHDIFDQDNESELSEFDLKLLGLDAILTQHGVSSDTVKSWEKKLQNRVLPQKRKQARRHFWNREVKSVTFVQWEQKQEKRAERRKLRNKVTFVGAMLAVGTTVGLVLNPGAFKNSENINNQIPTSTTENNEHIESFVSVPTLADIYIDTFVPPQTTEPNQAVDTKVIKPVAVEPSTIDNAIFTPVLNNYEPTIALDTGTVDMPPILNSVDLSKTMTYALQDMLGIPRDVQEANIVEAIASYNSIPDRLGNYSFNNQRIYFNDHIVYPDDLERFNRFFIENYV